MKIFKLLIVILLSTELINAQDLLNLKEIEEINNAPINKKEALILDKGFRPDNFHTVEGEKAFIKGLHYNSPFAEQLIVVYSQNKFHKPGDFIYRTMVSKHYGKLTKNIIDKYKHLGTINFDNSKETFDLYDGEVFDIQVFFDNSGFPSGFIIYHLKSNVNRK